MVWSYACVDLPKHLSGCLDRLLVGTFLACCDGELSSRDMGTGTRRDSRTRLGDRCLHDKGLLLKELKCLKTKKRIEREEMRVQIKKRDDEI